MGEQTQTPHLSLWGVGSLPTLPRAVSDLWSQVPAGFDFLGERLSDRDQDPGELPVWRGGGEGSGRQGQGERMKPPPEHGACPPPAPGGCGAQWPREPSHAPAAYRRGTASAPPRSWHSGREGLRRQNGALWRPARPRPQELEVEVTPRELTGESGRQ